MRRWLGLVGVALVVAAAATGAVSSIARGDDGGGTGDCSAQSTKSEQWKKEHCKAPDSSGTSAEGATNSSEAKRTAGTVMPNATGEMDCNGWSQKYKSVKQAMMMLCTDPIAIKDGKASRFLDNGWYVGHDEPSVKFISSAPGSGNHMTYYQQLAVDPAAAPTLDGSVTDYAELSPAPWFGLPICDPKSYPQNPCTPDSDANKGGESAQAAGSAFMELQFYPPGYQPFIDAPSCDATRYCAALTIDSLECNLGFEFCNPDCTEPVNFAYLQRDGVPAGPPSPQLSNLKTETPNGETLMMNQGDSLRVTIGDTPDGLKTEVDDLTTGQSGFMVASAANGFMNSDLGNCAGTPFSFHAEYDTASQQNQVPWAALEGGVLMQDEIGHFETCASVSNALAVNDTPLLPFDTHTFQTCNGGMEGSGDTIGEGPCNFLTGSCIGATTEGGGACPSDNFASGNLCEFSDAICMPAGSRPVSPDVTSGGVSEITWPLAACQQNFTQNGDLDYDGSGYRPDWPDGTANHPTPFRYAGPFDPAGNPYPNIQFETDAGGSEALCNTANGEHCAVPPVGASFYPFWTIGNQATPTGFPATTCLWNFGNDIAGVTTNDFGRTAEYGAPDVARYGGTLTSPVISNPQLSNTCGH